MTRPERGGTRQPDSSQWQRPIGCSPIDQSDCQSAAPNGVWPYAQVQLNSSTNTYQWTYYRADSFQIITAGADNIFGPGGNAATATTNGQYWSPANAVNIRPTGKDDQSNFHGAQLGVSQ